MGHKPIAIGRLLAGALATAAVSCWSCAPTSSSTRLPPPLPWHLNAIGVTPAWGFSQGLGEVIAILDSGLADGALPSLRAREIGPRPAPDLIGHGTAVTTLAAGSGDLGVWGVAPQARVIAINILDASGQISPEKVVAGINSAVQQRASVINMSFGQAEDSAPIKAAIDYAIGRGVVVVAAGGDTGSPSALFPADLAGEVIAVRALAENGTAPLSANTVGANGIDAPGENLPAVRVQDGASIEAASDGSSMAAAVVSGSVALLEACSRRSSGGVLGAMSLLHILRASADKRPWFDLGRAVRAAGC
ncbi:MAG TPA: S8 family serine peptidase [Candidatus Dormibacteraeota bacterium]